MSKKKPLSAAEKREKLLELLHETSEVYQLKDLERIAPKEKGIVQQSVKGVLQELVDDGQVCSDKMAGSIYYWSFPSATLSSTRQRLIQLETQCNEVDKKIERLKQLQQTASAAMKHAEEAAALTIEIETLKKEKHDLEQRNANTAGGINYAAVAEKAKDSKEILLAANRWTDNIFFIKSWCKRKFNKEDSELDKAFGIPEDLDYVNT